MAAIFAPTRKTLWCAGARKLVEDGQAIRFEPGVFTLPERRGGRQCQQVRQEIGGLVQEIDAQLIIGDADMHMHAADRKAPTDTLQISLEGAVSYALGSLLRLVAGERMRPGSDRRHVVTARHAGDRAAQSPKLGSRLVEAIADPCPDLDLRAQEFGAYLRPQQRLQFGQHRRRRVADNITRCAIDEEVLLLDAECKFRFGAHRTPRIEPVTARGSRRGQRPLSTWWKKSAQVRLNKSGSSRLTACPVFGNTTSAEVGIVRFIKMPGSRHG